MKLSVKFLLFLMILPLIAGEDMSDNDAPKSVDVQRNVKRQGQSQFGEQCTGHLDCFGDLCCFDGYCIMTSWIWPCNW
uniref:Conotoxin Cl6.15 n=1 Tax=Californiconus californicus TaxID=1736779 RepID=I16F_CONCL